MTIDEHIKEFAGLRIHDYSPDTGIPSPLDRAIRINLDWEAHESGATFENVFAKLVADPSLADVQALVIGDWGGTGEGNGSQQVVEALVSARKLLPSLRALFLGEITVDESEISWINQSDVSALFQAFPDLEELFIRGGQGLSLGRPRHARLRKLVIETGGLPADVVREVSSAELPSLEHLELWLGDEGYGNDVSLGDIDRLLEVGPTGDLRYLGLRDDCHADDTARLLAQRGIPASVTELDLSLGTLGDLGAVALAECDWIRSLRKLDIHHHYVSSEVVARLNGVVAELDAGDPRTPDEYGGQSYRYVAVAE